MLIVKRAIIAIMLVLVFIVVGCSSNQQTDATQTAEQTHEQNLSTEEVNTLLEKAGKVKLTDASRKDATTIATTMLPAVELMKDISSACGEAAKAGDIDDAFKKKVNDLKVRADKIKSDIEGLKVDEAWTDIKTLMIAFCKSTNSTLDSLSKAKGSEDENVKDATKYMGESTSYIDNAQKYTEIVLEKNPLEPIDVPFNISIKKVKTNSAGTPEVDIVFTNTGKQDIAAFDFYVKCYDAYGEIVKGYSRYDYYAGTYQEKTLKAGKATPSNWYWSLYGFDNTKTIEVAITKYKPTKGEVVEISEAQLKWIKQK